MSSNMTIPKTCELCGTAFIAKTTVTKFCSHKCASRGYKLKKRKEKVQKSLLHEIDKRKGNYSADATSNAKVREYVSITEASELIGVSRWTIQRMIQSSKLPSAKFGRRTIIKRTDIDQLFQA